VHDLVCHEKVRGSYIIHTRASENDKMRTHHLESC
jgi:hypothetical protein